MKFIIAKMNFITAALAIIFFCSCNKTTSPEKIVNNNSWDGVYNCNFGNYSPVTNPGYSCSTTLVHLITTDTNKVKLYWPVVAAYSIPTLASGSFIYFVAQEEELTINSSSNKVTVQNAAAGAVTFYSVSLSSPNNYDPVTRTFNVKFGYSYGVPGVFDVGCKEWMQTLTYVGPR